MWCCARSIDKSRNSLTNLRPRREQSVSQGNLGPPPDSHQDAVELLGIVERIGVVRDDGAVARSFGGRLPLPSC